MLDSVQLAWHSAKQDDITIYAPMSLNTQILVAAILGVLFGFLLNLLPGSAFYDGSLYGLSIASSIFIGLLKMLLIP